MLPIPSLALFLFLYLSLITFLSSLLYFYLSSSSYFHSYYKLHHSFLLPLLLLIDTLQRDFRLNFCINSGSLSMLPYVPVYTLATFDSQLDGVTTHTHTHTH
jgi:hypothetical protein